MTKSISWQDPGKTSYQDLDSTNSKLYCYPSGKAGWASGIYRLFLTASSSPMFPSSPTLCIATLALSITSTQISGLRLLSAFITSAWAVQSNKLSSLAHSPIFINPTEMFLSSVSTPIPFSPSTPINPTDTDKAGMLRKLIIHVYSIVDCVVFSSLRPLFKSIFGRSICQLAHGAMNVTMIISE